MLKNKVFPAAFLMILFSSCGDIPIADHSHITPLNIADCMAETGIATFDVITWNAREFPVLGEASVSLMADLIRKVDPDLIAFQEIAGVKDLENLTGRLPGWKMAIQQVSDLNPAFIYKTSEVSMIGQPVCLFADDPDAFPRPPLMISVEHHTGIRMFLINIHLKCCSGSENESRRRTAGMLLKTFIDEKLASEKVLVLGDFNDEIHSANPSENVFYDFFADSLHYRFLDMEIARGNPEFWSYPSWPGHIDHFLGTDEIFGEDFNVDVLAFDRCDTTYLTSISDHRPMILRFIP